VTEDDAQALVLRVFASYLSLMRRVQTTYWCGHHASVSAARDLRVVPCPTRGANDVYDHVG